MSQSPYLTDHATDKDLLRYEDFQAALHEIVTEADTPLTVGLYCAAPIATGTIRSTRTAAQVFGCACPHLPYATSDL